MTLDVPQRLQEVPQRPQEVPQRFQEVPQRPQEVPQRPQELPQRPQELPQRHQGTPRSRQGHPKQLYDQACRPLKEQGPLRTSKSFRTPSQAIPAAHCNAQSFKSKRKTNVFECFQEVPSGLPRRPWETPESLERPQETSALQNTTLMPSRPRNSVNHRADMVPAERLT